MSIIYEAGKFPFVKRSGLGMQGDLYEYMPGKLAAARRNGQFRTPKHI